MSAKTETTPKTKPNAKKDDYEKYGVREYIALLIRERRIVRDPARRHRNGTSTTQSPDAPTFEVTVASHAENGPPWP